MKIRSITYFCNPGWPLEEKVVRRAAEFLAGARSAYQAAGYEVQTTRLATIPFPLLLGRNGVEALPRLAQELDGAIQQAGIAYASLGPALPEEARGYPLIPEALAASENIFLSGMMADAQRGLSLAAVHACAGIIQRVSTLSPDGFANLRFAALANVAAGAPFFPAAYHDRDEPAFAIATEAADLAVNAFSAHAALNDGRRALIAEIEKHAQIMVRVARSLPCSFRGIDFSLAPFPEQARSLGAALERMGAPRLGLHGSLFAAALLTECLERAAFPRTGFSGLMMPILEDATLAQRAAEGTLTVRDLLLYSAVCGTGLDTVPLPGDTTAEQLVALLLDLCSLALRLDKPLTARLMPIPGAKAGEATHFDFPFFANSRVMALEAATHAPLPWRETIFMRSR